MKAFYRDRKIAANMDAPAVILPIDDGWISDGIGWVSEISICVAPAKRQILANEDDLLPDAVDIRVNTGRHLDHITIQRCVDGILDHHIVTAPTFADGEDIPLTCL